MCVVDRLKASIPGITTDELIRLDLLGQTMVFTSQGVPFIYAGEEVLRDKKGVHNSYKSPDSINAIDWTNKDRYPQVFDYYRGLMELRRNHPAFRMADASMVRQHLEFIPTSDCTICFRLKDNANGDSWQDIIVILNAFFFRFFYNVFINFIIISCSYYNIIYIFNIICFKFFYFYIYICCPCIY